MKLGTISKLDSITPMFKAANASSKLSAQTAVTNLDIKPGFAIGCDGDVHPESRTAEKGQKLYLLA